jgi:orotidine-5'-phosphate decarboxylase
VHAGSTADGTGLLLSSSREILYASAGEDFATAARAVALRTVSAIGDAAARR